MTDQEKLTKAQEMLKLAEIHNRFQKHMPEVEGTEGNGSPIYKNSISYKTYICKGCGMPVDRDHNFGENKDTFKLDIDSVEAMLGGRHAHEHEMSYIASVIYHLQYAKDTEAGNININASLVNRLHLFDQAKLHDTVFPKNAIPKLESVAKYSAHIKKGVDDETWDAIRKVIANVPEGLRKSSWKYSHYAPDWYVALAWKFGVEIPDDLRRRAIQKCNSQAIRHFVAGKSKKPQLSVIKSSTLWEAVESYLYIKHHRPEKMTDPKWMYERLHLSSYADLQMMYYLDTGLGLEHIVDVCQPGSYLLLRHAMNKYPQNRLMMLNLQTAFATRHKEEWAFIHGSHDERMAGMRYIDRDFLLALYSSDPQDYFKYVDAFKYNPGSAEREMEELLALDDEEGQERSRAEREALEKDISAEVAS